MSDDLRKLLFLGVAAAAVTALLIAFVPQWLGSAAGPEVEILTTLKNAESKGLELDAGPAGTLSSTRANFQRVSVSVTGALAIVTATLDFDGKLASGTSVSSLGLERIPFVEKDGEWRPRDGFAPQLTAVVRALEQRRRSLEAGDLSGLCFPSDAGQGADLADVLRVRNRQLKATAWLIRSEREDVTVAEDYRLKGELPERPVDDVGTRRLKLQAAAGAKGPEFCFPDGLM